MFDGKIFAERVLMLRKKQSIKQKELADILGLTKSAVSMIESGKRAASIEIIYSLADFFDVSVDYLIGRTNNPKRY